MTDVTVVELASEESLLTDLNRTAEVLLAGGVIAHPDFKIVYLGTTQTLSLEVKDECGYPIMSFKVVGADSSKTQDGGMVEIQLEQKEAQPGLVLKSHSNEELCQILQYMTQKAFLNGDSRYDEAAENWEGLPEEDSQEEAQSNIQA